MSSWRFSLEILTTRRFVLIDFAAKIGIFCRTIEQFFYFSLFFVSFSNYLHYLCRRKSSHRS